VNTPARLGIYVVGLLAAFGVAAGVGAAAGPIDVGGDDHDGEHAAEQPAATHVTSETHVSESTDMTDTIDTADSAGTTGVWLASELSSAPAGAPFEYRFTIEGPAGPIVDFAELHERRLHLIVVSDDLVDFWHLHPEMASDGTWHIEMPALEPRVYVVYADFQPVGGQQTTLQQRITVTAATGGAASPRDVPAPVATAAVGGFDVTLSGTPVLGESTLQFDVTRDGQPVTTEPYLGAAGHLVAIRAADYDYLHVHPLDEGGPSVRFAAELPTAGTYRLFFDFAVDGTVHTASFTLDVGPAAGPAPSAEHDPAHGEHGS
jgi:hypothetical protein